MGTAFCTLCAGVLLLFSSVSRATEPSVEEKTCLLSTQKSRQAKALAFYAQGLYYLRENPTPADFVLGVGSFRSAAALDPSALDSHTALINALLSAGDIAGAIKELQVVARMCTDRPYVGFSFSLFRLELLVATSDWDAAVAEWEKLQIEKTLIPQDFDLPEAYYLLGGVVLDQRGQGTEPLDLLAAGLLAYPDSHNMMNSMAYTLAVEGRELPRALDLIDRALVRAPEQYAYLDTLGWVLYKMGDYEGSFRSLSNALAYAPEDHHELYDHMGDVLFKMGREAEAPVWWAKSYSLYPDPAVAEKLRVTGIDPAALP